MSAQRHRNIVKFQGVTNPRGGADFGVVAEFMERGTLSSVLRESNTPLDMNMRLRMCLDVADGLRFLHAKGLVVPRLTSRKVLVNDALECKINLFSCQVEGTALPPVDAVGTGELAYTPPELLTALPPTSQQASGMFALGVVMAEILSGIPPYQSKVQRLGATRADLEVLRIIRARKDPLEPHERNAAYMSVSGHIRAVVDGCLNRDPARRPNAHAVVSLLHEVVQMSSGPGSRASQALVQSAPRSGASQSARHFDLA
ncbi:TPA: hypothetical protein N0F65_007523 [Lagenidium giganteum]|uniref:Protein kinase domain-containing protein n=1 Tax=Lagenidium giganteum TaxID=4803 RepID=A0AAV2ZHK3_9STRA|nr:TPA: hypothetical protein N0F65_007523 [Lagenidium giganteum]